MPTNLTADFVYNNTGATRKYQEKVNGSSTHAIDFCSTGYFVSIRNDDNYIYKSYIDNKYMTKIIPEIGNVYIATFGRNFKDARYIIATDIYAIIIPTKIHSYSSFYCDATLTFYDTDASRKQLASACNFSLTKPYFIYVKNNGDVTEVKSFYQKVSSSSIVNSKVVYMKWDGSIKQIK